LALWSYTDAGAFKTTVLTAFRATSNIAIGSTVDDGLGLLQVPGRITQGATVIGGPEQPLGSGGFGISNRLDNTSVQVSAGGTTGYQSGLVATGGTHTTTSARNTVDVFTASVHRLRVTATGELLVNTTTNNGVDKLQVAGNIQAVNGSVASAGGIGTAGFFLKTAANVLRWIIRQENTETGSGDTGADLVISSRTDVGGAKNTHLTLFRGSGNARVGSGADSGDAFQVNGSINASSTVKAAQGFVATVLGITTVLSADASGAYLESQGANALRVFSNGAEVFRASPGGKLLVATTTDNGTDAIQTPGSVLFGAAALRTSGVGALALARTTIPAGVAGGPAISFQAYYSGTTLGTGAEIATRSTSTWSGSNRGMEVVINTCAAGSSSLVTRLALGATGATFSVPVIQVLSASVTPANNGELMVQATSNTSLTFKYKGADGTVRSASLALA
jgi:hypothetical protein